MLRERLGRKEFMIALGRAGVTTCLCGAAFSMRAAFAQDPAQPSEPATPEAARPPSMPGDTTPARAAKRMEFVDGWVPRFFKVVDEELDEPTRRRVMEANGKACFSAYAADMPRRPEPATPERIAEWVAQRGEGSGYSMDGNVITFEYMGSAETGQSAPENVCLCPTAEAQTARTISPTFCWCSVGYTREMHERIFGRPVKVELTRSVLTGHPRCRFTMTLV